MSLSELQFDEQGIASTLIAGAVGNIEILISLPKDLNETSPITVISHPHPLYGGSMTNKVVHILAKSFSELSAITVRFNFRGVGKSEGEYDHGVGEAEDLKILASELRNWRPQSNIWLAGFSFGAYVATRAQAEIKPEKLLLVAPPVSMYPFDDLAEINIPWVVIQGGQDEVIEASAVRNWVSERLNQPKLIWMDDATHFFHGKLNDVKESLLLAW